MVKYHNFKQESPGYYVSKSGHSSNVGTDPNEPKDLPSIAGTAVIGAGEYRSSSIAAYVLRADGKVVFRPLVDGQTLTISFSNILMYNIEIWYADFVNTISSSSGVTDLNCTYRFCKGIRGGSASSRARHMRFAKIFDCNFGETHVLNTGAWNIFNSIVKRTTLTVNQFCSILDSYVDKDSILKHMDGVTSFQRRIGRCNYHGKIIMQGVTYELKRKKDGSPAEGTDPAIADIVDFWPDVYTTGANFREDPKFINEANEEFNIHPDSPHVGTTPDGYDNLGGTEIQYPLLNTEEGNVRGTRILTSSVINTSNPNGYVLNNGVDEGYIDYIEFLGGRKLLTLDIQGIFKFNSSLAGGSAENNNVFDAEPITSEYPFYTTTTAANTALNLVTVPTGKINVGQHIRVNGQPRQVISKVLSGSNDILTVDRNFSAAIGNGLVITYGSALQLASLNPNRLTVFMRTRSNPEPPTIPMLNAEWDNSLHAAYGKQGHMFNQEINTQPLLYVDGLNVYGNGDSNTPTGLAAHTLAPQWMHVRVYLRNNYNSIGLPS